MTAASAIDTSSNPSARTFVRLAMIGTGTDRLRIVLSALGAAAATMLVMAALNVVLIGGGGRNVWHIDRYQSALLDEPGLHPGVIITLLALTIPLIMFVGQCIRIGAPARDRRLASLRMAGATANDVRAIVTIETSLAAGLGALVGAILFAIGRKVVPNEPDIAGQVRLPTDVAIPVPAYVMVILAMAGLTAGATLLALRRTAINPFGVVHRHATKIPTLVPLILLVVAVGVSLLSALPLRASNSGALSLLMAFALFTISAFGLTVGAAGLGQAVGRLVRSRASAASLLLASARLVATPYRASRNLGAVLVAVMIGAAVQQTRVSFLLGTDSSDGLYVSAFDLLDFAIALAIVFGLAGLLIAAAEGITERRRTLAALVAMGTPRRTIAVSVVAEVVIPLVPGVVLAALAGTLAARSYNGSQVYDVTSQMTRGLPVPWLELALLCGGAIVAAVVVTSASLLLLPASVSTSELRTAA